MAAVTCYRCGSSEGDLVPSGATLHVHDSPCPQVELWQVAPERAPDRWQREIRDALADHAAQQQAERYDPANDDALAEAIEQGRGWL